MSWHLSLIPRHVGGVGAAEAQSFQLAKLLEMTCGPGEIVCST
jgi:hypothetical protein